MIYTQKRSIYHNLNDLQNPQFQQHKDIISNLGQVFE